MVREIEKGKATPKLKRKQRNRAFAGGARVKDTPDPPRPAEVEEPRPVSTENVRASVKEIPPFTFDFIWDTENILPRTDSEDRNRVFLGASLAKTKEPGLKTTTGSSSKKSDSKQKPSELNENQPKEAERPGSATASGKPVQETFKREATKTRKALNSTDLEPKN
jgi:hypothetical protein